MSATSSSMRNIRQKHLSLKMPLRNAAASPTTPITPATANSQYYMGMNPLILAALIRTFGSKISEGGYEVKIPRATLTLHSSYPFATIEDASHTDPENVVLRYFPHITIDAQVPDFAPEQPTIPPGASSDLPVT